MRRGRAPANGVSVAGRARVGFLGGDGANLTPPGKIPGVPDVVHIGSDYVQLLWAAPLSAGSHPLKGA